MVPEKHVTDLIPAYALDSLNPKERQQVAEHLKRCESCQSEVQAYRQVVDQLALAVPGKAPSAELKQKILRSLREKRLPATARRPASAWKALLTRLQTTSPAWAFASLFLIIILSASNLWMWQRLNNLEAVAQAGFRVVALVGSNKTPQASGMLVLSHDGDMGTLVVDGLPALDPLHQYQVWLIRDGKWTNGGVFSVSNEGYEAMRVFSDQPLRLFPAFEITVEPAGGSPAPTGEKVLSGSL